MTDRGFDLPDGTILLVVLAVVVLLMSAVGPALVSARPAGEIPFRSAGAGSDLESPTGSGWEAVPAVEMPVSSAPSGLPNAADTSVGLLEVQTAHTEETMYVRLSWSDATADRNVTGPRSFVDAAAVQVPVNRSTRPAIAMGSSDNPVNVWYWRADEGSEELLAGGAGTTTQFENSTLTTRATHQDGRWAVVFERNMTADAAARTDVRTGDYDTAIAFAVWNGTNMERSGRKAVSTWHHLPTGPDAGGPPFEAVLWAVAGLAVLLVVVVTAAAVREHGGE